MQVKSVELKTTKTNKPYKLIKLDTEFQGKDGISLFQGSPYYNKFNVGDTVDESILSLNANGYIEVGSPQNAQPTAPNPNTGIDVKLGFLSQNLKTAHEKLDRILVHIGAATKLEEAYATEPGKPFEDDAPPITDEDIPF